MYVVLMQGTNLAPISINTYVEGPIIGLNEGCIIIGEPVIIAAHTLIHANCENIQLTILYDLDHEDCDLHKGYEIDKIWHFAGKESFLLFPSLLLVGGR